MVLYYSFIIGGQKRGVGASKIKTIERPYQRTQHFFVAPKPPRLRGLEPEFRLFRASEMLKIPVYLALDRLKSKAR